MMARQRLAAANVQPLRTGKEARKARFRVIKRESARRTARLEAELQAEAEAAERRQIRRAASLARREAEREAFLARQYALPLSDPPETPEAETLPQAKSA